MSELTKHGIHSNIRIPLELTDGAYDLAYKPLNPADTAEVYIGIDRIDI